MINLNEYKNHKNTDFEAIINDSNIKLNFSLKTEDFFMLNTSNSSNININVCNDSSVELYQKIYGINSNVDIKISGIVEGNLTHVILTSSSNTKFNFNNETIVKNGGNYQIIILDLQEADNSISNTIKVYDSSSKGSILCASVVNKKYKKLIQNTTINKTYQTNAYMDNYGVSFDNGILDIVGIGSIEKGSYKSTNEQKDTMFVLDEGSKVSCKPYLYIDEDDVVASHANALGQIDQEALFYICSRGIEINKAKKMVVLGYFKKFVENINSLDIKNDIYKCIEEVTKNV